MNKILIKGAGILNADLILSALQEYAISCNSHGNYCRAKAVSELIARIDFESF